MSALTPANNVHGHEVNARVLTGLSKTEGIYVLHGFRSLPMKEEVCLSWSSLEKSAVLRRVQLPLCDRVRGSYICESGEDVF